MTNYGPYSVHPLADAFPLIDGEEFDLLVKDIKENGLGTPIVLNPDQSMIVDGRNRYRACSEAMVDPVFHTLPASYTDEQIAQYIVSENLRRRHLNQGQLAFLALRVHEHYADLAKARQIGAADRAREQREVSATNPQVKSPMVPADLREPGPKRVREATHQAAKTVGASGRAVQQAKAVRRDAPDLAEQVQAGSLALDNAYRQSRQRERAMPKPEVVKPTSTMLTLRTHDGTPVMYPQPKSKSQFNRTAGEGISWAGWSWNPVTGCLHGCDYCYARELATKESYKAAYPVGFTPLFHHERLDAPQNTLYPKDADGTDLSRVFVCSMADLYGRWVPDEWIDRVHNAMLGSPEWQYITLTKFPARYVGLEMPTGAWVGTSVDEQKRVRIAEEAFQKIDGVAVKWLSLEPLLEPLEFTDLSVFDWVVIGAQTETRQPGKVVPGFAPPFEWVARIVAQAKEAGCKVHMKPNLLGSTNGQHPGMKLLDEFPTGMKPRNEVSDVSEFDDVPF
jgi:protein gp37/ParB-like chromosome segregation protein Spo0J